MTAGSLTVHPLAISAIGADRSGIVAAVTISNRRTVAGAAEIAPVA